MSEKRYQQVMEIFLEAADLEGDARGAFLDRTCGEDEQLRRNVELLLAHDQVEGDQFEEKNLRNGHDRLAGAIGIDSAGSGVAENWIPPLPDRIGPYRILKKIGEGGMGLVHLAEQDHPQRRVALKMIRPGILSRQLLKRFRFEADVLGRLMHPGIAQIYEAGEVYAGSIRLPYFAMEYVEGTELQEYAREHDLSVKMRLELVARICDAVQHAHQKGIVHRDLKPENVFVVEQSGTPPVGDRTTFARLGQPKVLDFGVARAMDADVQMSTLQTDVGQLVGTIAYMSPEQVTGDPNRVDERSDIYALGVILYELLAGRPPLDLRHKLVPEATRIIREEEPTRLGQVRPSFRGDIDTIVYKAIEKDPGRRYSSAADLAADLRRYVADEPITAHPPSTFYQLSKFAKRHKGLVAGLALSFLILLAGTVTSLHFAVQALRGEKHALRSEASVRRTAIRLEITTADAVGENDPLRGLKHLEAVPDEFRGWEWWHLYTRLNSHICEHEHEKTSGAPSPGTERRVLFRDGSDPCAAFERDGVIELFDLLADETLAVFRGADELTLPNLSPDGSLLAVLNRRSGKLIVGDVRTGARLLEMSVNTAQVLDLCFSPDSSLIVVCSRMEGAQVIEVSTGRTRFFTAPYPTDARAVAFSPDGSRIVIVGGNRDTVWTDGGGFYLFFYSTGGERLAESGFGDGAGVPAFSADGTRVAVGHTQRMISLIDATTLERTDVFHGHTKPVSAVAFSPDGAFLASAAKDGTARIWDLSSGRTIKVISTGPAVRCATSLAFSRDSELLLAGSTTGARAWAWRRDACLVLKGHKSYVYQVVFSPDGRLVASADWDDMICLWHALTGRLLATLPGSSARGGLAFSLDGARLIDLAVWDPATGERLTTPRRSSDKVLFESLAGTPATLEFWRSLAPGGTQNGYYAALSPDRRQSAFVSESVKITIDATDRAGRTKKLLTNDAPVLSIVFSPDAKKLVVGELTGGVKVWDLIGNTELATLRGHQGEVFSVNYSPDGSRIVSGSNDGTIILWDSATFEQAAVLRGHGSYVHSVAFSPDGTRIASASGDRTVRIWDTVPRAERFRQIRRHAARQAEAEPLVDRLLREQADPLDVADRLRADENLDEELRSAALQVLLERSRARREKAP
jgi:eukaryotic-like serine/threonine-protein kinase